MYLFIDILYLFIINLLEEADFPIMLATATQGTIHVHFINHDQFNQESKDPHQLTDFIKLSHTVGARLIDQMAITFMHARLLLLPVLLIFICFYDCFTFFYWILRFFHLSLYLYVCFCQLYVFLLLIVKILLWNPNIYCKQQLQIVKFFTCFFIDVPILHNFKITTQTLILEE